MKKIAFVTTARSEFNASRFVIKAINEERDFELQLLVGGCHTEETIKEIKKDGFNPIFCNIITGINSKDISLNMSNIFQTVTHRFEYLKPDLLIVNGDRLELMPFILPAVLYKIPICHIGGGDLTEGSDDNQTRYAISRYAHLHLVSCQESADNLIQSGEEPWRVKLVGQCGLENILRTEKLSLEETSKKIGLDLSKPTALCIYYPAREINVTVEQQIKSILDALDTVQIQTIFVLPCAEIGFNIIRNSIEEYCKTHDNCKPFSHLENQLFQSVLQYCRFMIGNSSAGVIEAPFINKWSINVGNRQKGRKYEFGILDYGYNSEKIVNEIKFILNNKEPNVKRFSEFPSKKIVKVIKENLDRLDLLYKKISLGGQTP